MQVQATHPYTLTKEKRDSEDGEGGQEWAAAQEGN